MTSFARAIFVFTTLGLSVTPSWAEDAPAPAPAPVAPGPAPAPEPPPPPAAAPVAPPAPPPPAPMPDFGPPPVPPPPVPAVKFPGTETWPDFIPLKATEGRNLHPYGYRPVRKINRKFVAAGAGVFGGAYIGAMAFGWLMSETGYPEGVGYLVVPIVGPAAWGYSSDGYTDTTELVLLDTVAQATGVVLLTVGLMGREGWERTPGFLLVPVADARGAGLAASGRF